MARDWHGHSLSSRAFHCLENAGIKSPAQVTEMSDAELLEIPQFGRSTLMEIRALMPRRNCIDAAGWAESAFER